MFNLLPENLKDSIKSEYKVRRLTVILFFVVCVEASFLIFLFPTWLSSSYKEREIVSQSDQMNQFLKDANINPATGLIKTINTKLNIINTALEYPKVIPLVQSALSKKSSQITINQIVYQSINDKSAEMTLGGVSATREQLVGFVKSLQDTKLFTKVDLPISNLAKDKNIEFTIDLSIGQ